MSAAQFKVLVSGAGIAGPCFAYWLARTRLNASVTIVERSPTPRVTGQAVDIRGNAIEIVKRMGLEIAVRSRSTTEEGTIMVNLSGKTFARFGGGDIFTADYEILRADLSELFLEATERLDNVRYVYGDSIQGLAQTDANVHVTFDSGSQETYDLVVAADGAASKTRSMILDQAVLKNAYNFIGQYIAFFSIPSQPDDGKLWQWYNVPKGLSIMLRPHQNSSTVGAYLVVTTPGWSEKDTAIETALNQGVEESKKVLRDYFKDAGWQAKRILKGMDHADDFYMSRCALVRLPQWTHGRALVLGDAAFATFGVGTSLAIESAYALAGELSKIKSTDEVPHALQCYEQIFRPMHSKMDGLFPGYPQIAFPQSSWALWLRNSFLWLMSKTQIYKLFPDDSEVVWRFPEYDWIGK